MRGPGLSIVRPSALIAAFMLGAAALHGTLVSGAVQGQTVFPSFEAYPSTAALHGAPAAVQINSAPYGRMFRTMLRNEARKGPNFAGAFTVVVWGCGSSCQVVAIVNATTGVLSKQTLRTTIGIEYRRDSRLIIADPVRAGDPPLDKCAACGTPAAYEWTGAKLVPVGPGPHPHMSGDRPW